MLLRRVEDGWLAITQPAHAWLSGELASAWGGDRFAVPAPVDAVIRAAALHDIGWLDWEEAPRFDPGSGLPVTFPNVPAEDHTALWRRGVERAALYGAYVGLLVSRHGDSIYERHFAPATASPQDAAAARAFLDWQSAWQAATIARLADDPAMADAVSETRLALTKRFIVAVDVLSLHLCWGKAGQLTIDDVPMRDGKSMRLTLASRGGTMTVDPWPFTPARLDFAIEGRRLTGKVDSQAALDETLASAGIVRQPITVRPA